MKNRVDLLCRFEL